MPGEAQPFELDTEGLAFALVVLFGGDNNLTGFVNTDLNEMRAALPHDGLVLALTDHFDKSAKAVAIQNGRGRVLEDLGEIDTGDPQALLAFLDRVHATVPANVPMALGFWDHGTGVFDETDPDETIVSRGTRGLTRRSSNRRRPRRRLFFGAVPADPSKRAMLHDDTNGGALTNLEAGAMLAASLKGTGRPKYDMIFSDTCLNGMVEVLAEFAEYAEVVTASQDLEPGDGWDYTGFLTRLSNAGDFSGSGMGRAAVEAYCAHYREDLSVPVVTQASFHASNAIVAAFKAFVDVADALGEEGFRLLDVARARSVDFDAFASYDIVDFAGRVANDTSDANLEAAANALKQAVLDAQVANCCRGAEVEGAQGLAFWFPSSRGAWRRTSVTYAKLAFDKATGWSTYVGKYR